MTQQDWQVGYAKTLTVVFNGAALNERDRFGRPVRGSSLRLFFNASEVPAECVVPGRTTQARWRLVFDTAVWPDQGAHTEVAAGAVRPVQARSLVVLQQVNDQAGTPSSRATPSGQSAQTFR